MCFDWSYSAVHGVAFHLFYKKEIDLCFIIQKTYENAEVLINI